MTCFHHLVANDPTFLPLTKIARRHSQTWCDVDTLLC